MGRFNQEKFENILLYLLKRCSSIPSFGHTVLYKLLYFIDFDFYELQERSLTGEVYRKIDYGPAPTHFNKVMKKLKKEGKIKTIDSKYYAMKQRKLIPLTDPDLSKITAEEITFIDGEIAKLAENNAKKMEELSHEDVPCKSTKNKDIIGYELVFYRSPTYSVRNYDEE